MFGFNRKEQTTEFGEHKVADISSMNSFLDLEGVFPDLVDYFNTSDDGTESAHLRPNQIQLNQNPTPTFKMGDPMSLPPELTLDFDHYRQPMPTLFPPTDENDFSSAISPYLSECPTPTPGTETPTVEALRSAMPKLDMLKVQEIENGEESEDSPFSSADEAARVEAELNNGQGLSFGESLEKRLSQLNEHGLTSEDEFDDSVPGTPRKRRQRGTPGERLAKRASTSTSLVGSDEEDAYDDEEEEPEEFDSDEEEELVGSFSPPTKKYKQPVSLKAENLHIGNWALRDINSPPEPVTLDVKILFGRRKIKYEMCRPNKQAKSKTTLLMDYPFSHISGLDFKPKERTIIFQLSEPPTFTKKERGKCAKVTDFTSGNASMFQRHRIEVSEQCFDEYTDRLLSCDRRLRQLAKIGLVDGDPSFPNLDSKQTQGPLIACDWDKENRAIKHCEECKANYCDICDDVLHRHTTQKTHRRVPVEIFFAPAPQPKPRKCVKKRKKTNSDRCRCGTGATKGTLGEPCTGNRCPCFSGGKNCSGCGCKNCHNPIKKSGKPNQSGGSPGMVASTGVSNGAARKLNIKQEAVEV